MTEQEILAAVGSGEASDWEFKSAAGGLPQALWETYSGMSNTSGGTIVLGVSEKQGVFQVTGIPDPVKMRKSFWDTINDRGKVSANLLRDEDVATREIEGKAIFAISVPRAGRRQRPIYIGQNPLTGTYRRNSEGDYKCPPDEVGRMLSDQSEEPADSRVLEHFGIGDLDQESIQQYRQIFSSRRPTHVWLADTREELLRKMGAWRRDRTTGTEGVTVAGLLMFGSQDALRDPAGVSQYHVDYRERLSDDPQIRWTDRLAPDGTWTHNLFQFYRLTMPRLTRDLRVPFQLRPDMVRVEDTPVHEALREAVVNALIHSDYRGAGGIVIERFRSRIEISNPGTLLVSYDQLMQGGVSECRNKSLQLMFQMLGVGEQAGSGMDRIRRGWDSQKWRAPEVEETLAPDRVRLILPMESLLAAVDVARLEARYGDALKGLSPLEVQTLITADLEGRVSNSRMQLVSDHHPAELTHLLLGLVGGGFLEQVGHKRGTYYRLASPANFAPSERIDDSPLKMEDSPPNTDNSTPKESQSPAMGVTGSEDWDHLLAIAGPARRSQRLAPATTRTIVSALSSGRYLTAAELGELMRRDPKKLREKILTPMAREGLLRRRFPEEPNRPDQAYTTATTPPPHGPLDKPGEKIG